MSNWFAWPFDPAHDPTVAGWGFWFGVLGLALTIGGFALTWVQLARAQSVAAAIKDEAERIQTSLKRYDATHEASRARYALEVARRHFRGGHWEDGRESYEEFRRSLVALKMNLPTLSSELVSEIEECAAFVSKLCERIDRDVQRGTVTVNLVKTIAVIRRHDELMLKVVSSIEKDVF